MTKEAVITRQTTPADSTEVTAHILSPEDIPYVWEEVEPMLAMVSEHTEGELLTEDFMTPLEEGHMQLWVAIENKNIIAAMVTQVVTYPQKRVLRIIALGGEGFKKIKEFTPMVESFAVRLECSSLELWGRKGWKKLLPDWKSSYIVYTKDIKMRMQ